MPIFAAGAEVSEPTAMSPNFSSGFIAKIAKPTGSKL
jgi:hypothetical protein